MNAIPLRDLPPNCLPKGSAAAQATPRTLRPRPPSRLARGRCASPCAPRRGVLVAGAPSRPALSGGSKSDPWLLDHRASDLRECVFGGFGNTRLSLNTCDGVFGAVCKTELNRGARGSFKRFQRPFLQRYVRTFSKLRALLSLGAAGMCRGCAAVTRRVHAPSPARGRGRRP